MHPDDGVAEPTPLYRPDLDTPLADVAAQWAAAPESFDDHALEVAVEIAYRAGSPSLAAEWLRRLIRQRPDDGPQQMRLVGMLLQAGDETGAAAAMVAYLKGRPDDAQGWLQLAELRLRQGDEAGVLAALSAIRDEDAQQPAQSLARGRLLLALRKPLEARAVLEAIPEAAGAEFLAGCQLRAHIASFLNRPADMAEIAEAGLRVAPDDVPLLLTLARAQVAMQRWAEALWALETAAAAGEDGAEFHLQHSATLLQLGRLREALEAALRGVERAPQEPGQLYHAAAIALRLSELDLARELLEQLLGAAPGHVDGWLLRVEVEIVAGRRDVALDLVDRARNLSRDDERLRTRRVALLQDGPTISVADARLPDRPLPRRRDRSAPLSSQRDMLRSGMVGQVRALQALVGYRIHHMTQFSRLGIFAAIVEPLLHMAVLAIAMYYFNQGRPPLGNDLFFFYASGVLCFIAFSHVVQHSLSAYRDDAALLQIPVFKRTDLVLSVAVAHLVIDGIACALILGAMLLLIEGTAVQNWWTAAGAFLGAIALGTGLAFLAAALNSISRAVQKGWVSVQRLLYVVSGVFYLPMHLPEGVREWMLLNPVLHVIEWFRHGIYPQYDPPWFSPAYVLQWALVMTVLGLVLELALRRHVRI